MSSCTFKPKGMSYTEFLRSKKSTAVKVINTKKLQDASDITTQRRLGASQVFAMNNEEVKGVINHPPDFSQEPLRELQSSYKTGGSGRKPGDASDFTAYTGGQAIGKEIQAGLPPARITQTPAISLTSSAVPQSASDFTRRTQGCKESLGQPHQATTVTPPVFVDDTIRNLGNPTQCTTQSITRSGTCANSITSRPANHSIKAETAFQGTPNRPSQGGGQYGLKGDREPGKEAGAFGGVTIAHVKSNIPVKSIRTKSGINVNYKVGAALDNIPYVEKHHGNDLGVNPKQPFVKYQIPGGVTPAHLKINKPISTLCCPTGRPIDLLTLLEQIATLTSPGVYTLNGTTVILPGQTLTIPAGITLKIPPEVLLTNNGIVLLYGTIDNDDFTNNATFTIATSATFITTVLFTNSSTGTVTNGGVVTVTSTGTVTNSGSVIITSTGEVTNSGTITNNAVATVTNSGTIINNAGATLTNVFNGIFSNNSIVTNDGTLANSGTLTNGGTITNNNLITNSRNINNNSILINSVTGRITSAFGLQINVGSTFTNAGILTNTNSLNFYGTIFNTGSITSTFTTLYSTNITYNYNGGIFTQNTAKDQRAGYQLNNANGSGGCGTGTLNGTAPLTATGTTCPPSAPVLEDPDLSGYEFTNSASITVNETGGTTFQWYFSNNAGDVPLTNGSYSESTFDLTVSGATTSTVDITIDAYIPPGTPSFNVYCIVTNVSGSVTTGTATITYEPPIPVLEDPDLSGYEFTNSASITVNETGGTTFQWYFSNEDGDVPLTNGSYTESTFDLTVSGATTSTVNINIDAYNEPGTPSFNVYCIVTNEYGSVTTGTATITYAP